MTATLKLTAYCETSAVLDDNGRDTLRTINVYDQPIAYGFTAEFATKAEAEEFAARFPKSTGMRATSLSGSDAGNEGYVRATGSLAPNKSTGARNETAIKRYHAMLRAAVKLGVEVEYAPGPYSNVYPTREAFEAAIA